MPANPNCYNRGNVVCWRSSTNDKRNVLACVQGYVPDFASCKAARARFCRIYGTQVCPNGLRICSGDNCSDAPIEVYAPDEGQRLDKLLDAWSGRNTTLVNYNLGQGVQTAADPLSPVRGQNIPQKKSSPFVIPALAIGTFVLVMFVASRRKGK
jgi:hypothetical protein